MEAEDINILVACEASQEVTKAFREKGFNAFSNDMTECYGGHEEWHIKGDAIDIMRKEHWHAVISFPPCTHLSAAGAPSWKQKQKDGRQQLAFKFVTNIYDFEIPFISIENPTGFLNTNWKKPDQIFHPFHFGDPYKKRTCLWLKGFPKLIPTDVVIPTHHYTSNSTRGGLLKDGTRKKSVLPIRKAWDNSTERSKTFSGIAIAMADQWGPFLLEKLNK